MNEDCVKINGVLYKSEGIDELYQNNEPTDSWQNSIYFFLKNWFDTSDVVISFTSGSTGEPKEIGLKKAAMRNSAKMTNRYFGLNANSTALLCLPSTYIAGKMMLVRAIVGGFNLICVEPKANPFEDINTVIDFTAITPYQLIYSIETLKTISIRNIIVGGGHVNTKLEKLAQSIPANLFETFGMTETCSHIALRQFNGSNKIDYFMVLDGVSIRMDERKCLIIHAPHLQKYEIVTNDFVEIIEENTFRWLGRFDSTINTGSVKVHPEQIENKLEEIISTNFFVSSLPDEILENRVILVIESIPQSELKLLSLKREIETILSKFEVPKDIYFTEKFVYSAGNKILKNETLNEILFSRR